MQKEKGEQNIREGSGCFSLTLRMMACSFLILLLAAVVSYSLVWILKELGLLNYGRSFRGALLLFALTSVILGTFFSWIFWRLVMIPIRETIQAADEMADGNFDVHIDLKGAPEARELSRSFNHMADELKSLELLRSDFVNNFSHEFKTPIVSIRGFAKMLQRDDLTEEERQEYLDIIVEESDRLTTLAANVLNLSKIENQMILTDQTEFNCSEQIRRDIVLLEPKWSKKNQDIVLECDEIQVYGNMELLEQVWINLLDNAIKFSPENGVIRVMIRKRPGCVLVTVSDEGEGIPAESQEHIFDKFYQGDTSHTVPGNGLGLAIAKRIVELHEGKLRVAKSDGQGTVFEVTLPD